MGGNSTSRSAADRAEDVTLVKGIRLTDRVIGRMRASPAAGNSNQSKRQTHSSLAQSTVPLGETGERLTPVLPHPSYASSRVPPLHQEPMTPLVTHASETKQTPVTPSPGASSASIVEPVSNLSPHESIAASAKEHFVKSPPIQPTSPPVEPLSTTTPLPGESEVASLSSPIKPALTTPSEALDASLPVKETLRLSNCQLQTELKSAPIEATTMSQIPDTEVTSSAFIPSVPASKPVSGTDTHPPPTEGPVIMPPPAIEPLEVTSDILATPDELTPPATSHLPPFSAPPSPGPEELINQEHSNSNSNSCALTLPSELPSMGQTAPPPLEEMPAPPPASPASGPTVPSVQSPFIETTGLLVSQQAAVNEEQLRKQIRDGLQELLREEIKIARLKILQQLEEEEANAKAEAQAKAQLQIQAKVQELLEREQAALQQSLKDAVMKERMSTGDERLRAQYYWMERKIRKLEEKEKEIAMKDSFYREQVAKLNEKTAQITKVTAESFKKGLEDTQKRFKRYQITPVCSELQSEIMKCYRENTGQTLACSKIASLYLQCVNKAKQNKLVNTGG